MDFDILLYPYFRLQCGNLKFVIMANLAHHFAGGERYNYPSQYGSSLPCLAG